MAKLAEILEYISAELTPASFKDASLNGIQIEGKSQVKLIAAAVDAAESTVAASIAAGADLLLVHHGIFWGKCLPIRGPRRELIKQALCADLSLVAMHLPLDANKTFGNNFLLAQQLGLAEKESVIEYGGELIGCMGTNKAGHSRKDIESNLAKLQGCSTPFVSLPFGPETPKKVCVVSGAAADGLYEFERYGFDTFISGEPKQFAYHFCKENKLNAFFPGHYATETLGVAALAEAIAERFTIPWKFIDQPTGI